MRRNVLVPLSVLLSCLFGGVSACHGQSTFGVTRQNGVVTGGSLQVGGFVAGGRTGVTMGLNPSSSQLIGVGTFSVPNGAVNLGVANNQQQPRPSVDQFVQNASRFDSDGNERLDEQELAKIGTAVLAELEELASKAAKAEPRSRRRSRRKRPSKSKEPTKEEQVKAFVKRCLHFDRDKDKSLDEEETKRMASALLRSLG